MAKPNDLKRKLKAAQRRRARRPSTAGDTNASDANASHGTHSGSTHSGHLDVIGLCVEEILNGHGRQSFRDSEVILALRAHLNGGTPGSAQAQLLHQRLHAVSQREDVTSGDFRQALNSLLTTAKEHRGARDDGAFIRYLTVLAS